MVSLFLIGHFQICNKNWNFAFQQIFHLEKELHLIEKRLFRVKNTSMGK